MEQRITIEQLNELSPQAQQRLHAWFDGTYEYGDDLIDVYIPEEKDGEYGGHFTGQWDSEKEFIFPEEYIGKIQNHRGTILPLLTVGQMIEFLDEHDKDDLACRLQLLLHTDMTKAENRWSFDTGSLLYDLWEGVKTVLEQEMSSES